MGRRSSGRPPASVRVSVVVVLVVAVLATGCGASKAGAPRVLASWARSGGFTGRADSVIVRTNGQVVARVRNGAARRSRLSSRRLATLRGLARTAHLPRHANLGGPSCCDQFSYVVATPGHRVAWTDGAKVPRRILRLEGALAALAPE